MPGVGKSFALKNVALYLGERGMYPGGILYANLSGVHNLIDALIVLIQKLEDALGLPLMRS